MGLMSAKEQQSGVPVEEKYWWSKKRPWIGAVLDGFLPIFPPFVTIISKPILTGLDFDCELVIHPSQTLVR